MVSLNSKIKLVAILSRLKKLEKPFSVKRVSKKQYNLELNEAMKRIDDGYYLTHSEVEKLLRK